MFRFRGDIRSQSSKIGCPHSHTVIKAFGGLVIYRAIAGNITSYSREIYSQLKSLLQHGFPPAIAGNCPSFVFPAIAGIFPRFNLGIVPGSAWELSQLFMRQERTLLIKNCFICNLIVQWLGRQLAATKDMGSIPSGCYLIFFTSQPPLIVL